jgi:hypothetical protein
VPVYYPACLVNIFVRWDESLEIVTKMPEPEAQDGETNVDAVSGADANVDTRPIPPDGPRAEQAEEEALGARREDLFIPTSGPDQDSAFLNIVPRMASVEMPGYRTAGSWSMQVQWREFPIDPRLVRAGLVRIFQGTVNPEDFATGMMRTNPDGTRSAVLRASEDNLAMVGLVDSWKVTHDAQGSWVTLEGRDLRGMFLDSPVNPQILSSLNYAQPLNVVVRDLMSKHPAAQTKYFDPDPEVDPDEWPKGKIPVPADSEIRPSSGASGKKSKIGVQTGKANYWDIVTNLCFRVGAIPYLENQTLRIRPARGIFSRLKPTHPSHAPFRQDGVAGPREDWNGERFFVRKMIHGRNIESLNFERKYTGVKVPVIEVISVDHSNNERGKQKLLKVQVPSKEELAARVGSVSPDGLVSQTEKVQIPVMGVRSLERLKEVARNLYEEIGQGELGGSIKTKNLSSFLGAPPGGGEFTVDSSNKDPDLLTLRPGDAVEIATDIRAIGSRAPIVNEFTDFHRRDFDEQVEAVRQAMKGKGGVIDLNTARALVASSRANVIDVLRYFRVYNIRWNWAQGVVDIAFDFHNYFIARYSILDPPENTQAKEKTTKKPKRKRRRQKKKPPKPAPPKYVPQETTFTRAAQDTSGTRFIGTGSRPSGPGFSED